ncbi:MAG: 30S ribosome-binding factor RbfA [Clostridia bacterium]
MQRHERLEQDSKVALSSIIAYDIKSPLVTGVISVTDVKITPDQKYAKVYISVFGKKNKLEVIEALQKASGFIRTQLGKKVRMRNVPALVFQLDDSLEYGSHMDKVINDVINKDNEEK